jgi:hypothetical protein
MNWLRSLPLFSLLASLAFVGISCTTTTNTTVINSLAPTISRFSPDTAWTFQTLTIYGTNFGYDPNDVHVVIDTALAQVLSIDDTVMKVLIPEVARTGFIHVRAYEQTGTSARPVIINYTFSPHYFTDTATVGSSFSIPGTGMNNYPGFIQLSLNGTALPVDSIFADRIVSHVLPNCYSGPVTITDSIGTYNNMGTLTVTRPSSWKTLSEIWDNLTVRETHERIGYENGPANTFDSTWYTTAVYSGQHDINIAGGIFARTAKGVTYQYSWASTNDSRSKSIGINWDTVHQVANVSFSDYFISSATSFHSLDTDWYDEGDALSAPLPVDADIEFMLPSLRYQITEDSTDGTGLVKWQETTNGTITSGSFDLIFKH